MTRGIFLLAEEAETFIWRLIFKALILQSLYALSNKQAEYHIRDRVSFMRFLGLGLEDRVPDATILWLYREALVKTGLVEQLFAMFGAHLRASV